MKILILIDWFAPAFKGGGPIQSIMNMVENAEPEFEYKIVCSNKDRDGTILQEVTHDTWVDYNKQTKVWYSSNNREVLKIVNAEAASWRTDILFINHIYSPYYNFLPVVFGKSPRKIISVRGALHDGALAQKSFKKKIFLWMWKLLNLHRKYEFHASTEEEKGFVEKAFGTRLKISIAANFPRIIKSADQPSKESFFLKLISVALISPMKNHLPVLEALQTCKENIQYEIYGPVKDEAYWQKCKEQMQRLPPNINVQYKGELPPYKVEAVLNAAHVFILPSKSENFGHAIYEALISGKPVITSHGTPWNGLKKAKAGLNVLPVATELKEAIVFFAKQDNIDFIEWSQGANRYARQMIDLQKIKEQYKKMFLALDAKEKITTGTSGIPAYLK